jgi:bifunctional UDP-N-acetylglucosamine pyrophosphorylase/glucosamine-1-phosphate N-acetyltransferase
MLIAPVKIFSKAKTGAGSVVTKNIKSGIAVKGVPARPYDREITINQKDEND